MSHLDTTEPLELAHGRHPWPVWAMALSLACAGCATPGAQAAKAGEPPALGVTGLTEPEDLLIQGYNYTDRYIDSFTVNGQGGGNVFVSSPTSSGGGSVCCSTIYPGVKPTLTIRWTASYCSYTTTNRFGETFRWRRGLWRELQVPLTDVRGPIKALEVHFYPDGHVEAAATPGYSPPRLKLPVAANRERPGVNPDIPVCPDEQAKP